MTKARKNLLDIYEKGYRVVDGEVFYKGKKTSASIHPNDYRKISTRNKERKKCSVWVHRLVAYQKYGDKIFISGLHVRHLDNNKTNNFDGNISLGTPSQNAMDNPKEMRLSKSKHAASFQVKHDPQVILHYRDVGMTYKQIMEMTGITSKGTISYIINKIGGYTRIQTLM